MNFLGQMTPRILTFNEEANISRTLSRLRWARRIVVVDSYRTDRTVPQSEEFDTVKVVGRRFDGLAKQWTYELLETGLDPEWVLALDTDYYPTDALIEKIGSIMLLESAAGSDSEAQG